MTEEINVLITQKHIAIRQFDRKEITEEEYNAKILEIENKIKEVTLGIIQEKEEIRKKQELEDERRRATMPTEQKEKKEFKPRGPKKDSYAAVILEVLQKRGNKTIEQVADLVLERKPGRDKASLKAQINVMINEVKKGKKPQYTWDAENFRLSLK